MNKTWRIHEKAPLGKKKSIEDKLSNGLDALQLYNKDALHVLIFNRMLQSVFKKPKPLFGFTDKIIIAIFNFNLGDDSMTMDEI